METTIENNKLISEFIGGTNEGTMWKFPAPFRYTMAEESRFDFHTSWDWLMPVVEKIESLGHGVTIYRKGCHINNDAGFHVNGFNHSNKLEQTYKAVVEFIKWYNVHKKSQ